MISRAVISMELVLAFLFGLVPIVVSIGLLVTKKIRGSCFWCGILGLFIASIVSSAGVIPIMFDQNKLLEFQSQKGTYFIVYSLAVAALIEIARLICTGAVLKKRRTFRDAVSFGAGFVVIQMVSIASNMISFYSTSAKINNGSFDRLYKQAIDSGYMTKEQLIQIKQIYFDQNVTDLAFMIPVTIFSAIVAIALSVLLVKGLREKYGFLSFIIALVISVGSTYVASAIDNNYVTTAMECVLATAGIFYILKVKDSIKEEPEAPVIPDSFMESINTVKSSENNSSDDMSSQITETKQD